MKVRDRQKGLILLEILMGLALVGIITVAFLNGLSTTFQGVSVSQERVTAESLAKSQIEYIKVQDYIHVADYNPIDPARRYELINIPADVAAAGYTVEISPPQTAISGNGTGGFELQNITVTVKRNDQGKLIISIYRVSD